MKEDIIKEDNVLNQVTLILRYKTDENGDSISSDTKMSEENAKNEQNERRLSEEDEKQSKNERRLSEDLSEALTASDLKKVEKIILYLEESKNITPQICY